MPPEREPDTETNAGTRGSTGNRIGGDSGGERDERSEAFDPLLADRFEGLGPTGQRVALLALAAGLFALAFGAGRATMLFAEATVGVGEPGTVSRLLVGVAGLQVLGFGIALALVALDRPDPLSYLQVGSLDQWTLFYGAAVGLAMMLLTVAMTLAFQFLPVELAEPTIVVRPELSFFVVLFLLSTFVAVPMEEVFFRGIVQRSLAAVWHPAVAIGVASLLFVAVHTTVLVTTGGEAILFGLFVSFGVVLGVSYHVTGNLLVPIVGHALFNGAQILTQAVDVAL